MQIKKFKFSRDFYTEKCVPKIVKATRIYGMVYLGHYIKEGLNFIETNGPTEDKILTQIKESFEDNFLQTIAFNYVTPERYLKLLDSWVSQTLQKLPTFEKNIIAKCIIMTLKTPIKDYQTQSHFFQMDPIFHFFTDSKWLINQRIENYNIDLILNEFKKRFGYIYATTNSYFPDGSLGKNWFSYDYETRGKEKIKYVIPFYRKIDLDAVNYHFAYFLNLPLNSNNKNTTASSRVAYPETPKWWTPYPYNNKSEKFADRIRLLAQKSSIFNVGKNYTEKNGFYFYKEKMIEINFNQLYTLNKLWYTQGLIIKNCKKDK